jgi:hypothetical protein
MPEGMHTAGPVGRPHVPTSEQLGLIIVIGGSVFNAETSSDGTQTAVRINSACCDDLGYWSKGFDSNFLSLLQFLPFLASLLQRLFHSFPYVFTSKSISFVLNPFYLQCPPPPHFFILFLPLQLFLIS